MKREIKNHDGNLVRVDYSTQIDGFLVEISIPKDVPYADRHGDPSEEWLADYSVDIYTVGKKHHCSIGAWENMGGFYDTSDDYEQRTPTRTYKAVLAYEHECLVAEGCV